MVPDTPGVTVKVVVFTVETFMASLKVAVTTELGQTPSASLGGAVGVSKWETTTTRELVERSRRLARELDARREFSRLLPECRQHGSWFAAIRAHPTRTLSLY